MTRLKSVTEKARAYLGCADAKEAERLQEDLDSYEGDFDAVVESLKPTRPAKPETGWTLGRPFRTPRLAAKYPGYALGVFAPPDYDPAKARGLALFLHGGGKSTDTSSVVKKVVESYGIRDLLEESGRIVCFPPAPPNAQSFSRWALPEVDEYLADVIEEVGNSYNLDWNNIILGGSSMGGIGAIHVAQRMADRFTSVLASASSWEFAYWPCLTGTTLWMLQGINDAVMFKRRHGTDVEFARLARMRMEQTGVSFVYREHSGGHPIADGRHIAREWLQWSRDRRRDPFYPHVVAVSPRGMTPWMEWRRHKVPLAANQNRIDFHELAEAPHARWVTIDGIGEETIIFDMVTMSECRDEAEADWNDFSLSLKRKHVPGGLVEAHIRDDKVIEATPKNVTGFTLWLHPAMVDLNNVRVLVKGVEAFNGPVKPTLGTLLESYKRRRDWGMLYPAKLRIQGDESWGTKDQLEVRV